MRRVCPLLQGFLLCILWESGKPGVHVAMSVLGIMALLIFILPFGSACIWATKRYPSALRLQHRSFLHCFRFLFLRFKPNRYVAGAFLLTRSLILSVIPVVFTGDVMLQVVGVTFIIVCSFVLHCRAWYWRGRLYEGNRIYIAVDGDCDLATLVRFGERWRNQIGPSAERMGASILQEGTSIWVHLHLSRRVLDLSRFGSYNT